MCPQSVHTFMPPSNTYNKVTLFWQLCLVINLQLYTKPSRRRRWPFVGVIGFYTVRQRTEAWREENGIELPNRSEDEFSLFYPTNTPSWKRGGGVREGLGPCSGPSHDQPLSQCLKRARVNVPLPRSRLSLGSSPAGSYNIIDNYLRPCRMEP